MIVRNETCQGCGMYLFCVAGMGVKARTAYMVKGCLHCLNFVVDLGNGCGVVIPRGCPCFDGRLFMDEYYSLSYHTHVGHPPFCPWCEGDEFGTQFEIKGFPPRYGSQIQPTHNIHKFVEVLKKHCTDAGGEYSGRYVPWSIK